VKVEASMTVMNTIAVSVSWLAAATASFALQAPPPRVSVPRAGVTVPMRDFGGRPVIAVTIHGAPVDVVLDTGAAVGALDPDVATAMGLDVADGRVAIDAMTIGAVKLTSVTLRATTFMRGLGAGAPSGVMSASWFPKSLVTFDFPRHTLTIAPGALPAPDDRTIFACDPSSLLPTIPVSVAGHAFTLHLDTGSPGGVMLPMAASTLVPLAGPLTDAPPARTMAGAFEVKVAPVKGDVTIGRFAIDAGPVRFSDLRPGPGPAPGNIGAQALRSFALTYDSTNRRVKLTRD
jgi:hypothetical protein